MSTTIRILAPAAAIGAFSLALSFGCSADPEPLPAPVDPQATVETVDLLRSLHAMAGQHTLFGHQNTLAYGYSWVDDGRGSGGEAPGERSDVKDVTGSYPALFGWDLMELFPADTSAQVREAAFDRMVDYARRSVELGGVVTFSWHMRNPLTGNSFYDTTSAVHAIVPGGERHEAYKADLDRVAAFFQALGPEPVIFRPFHEHNGDWFWWCKASTDERDYVAIWQFTQDYLTREKGVHNLLWAYSPDRSRMSFETFEEEYEWGYPGDERVDILGLDNYWDVGHKANTAPPEQQRVDFVRSLTLMGEMALDRGKVTALTETGYEAIPDSTWWTGVLLEGLQANRYAGQSVYLQVWRNANVERERMDHYYAPFPGHPSAPDFVRFMQSERMVFETELDSVRVSLEL